MYCKKCGNLLTAGDTVCKNCGEIVTPQTNQEANVVSNNDQNVNVEIPNSNQTDNPSNVTREIPKQNDVSQPNLVNSTINADVSKNNVTSTPINNVTASQQMNVAETQVQQNSTVNQPQTMNMEQTMAQPNTPVNTQNVNSINKQSNNKSFFIVIVVILAIIIIGLLGVVLYKGLIGDGSSNNSTTTTTTTTNPVQDNVFDDDNESSVNDSNTISFYGFEFSIPEGFVGNSEDNYMTLTNTSSKIAVRIDLYQGGRISNIESQSEELKTTLASQGINVTSSGIQNYEGIDWYIFDCNDGTYNYKYAFIDLGENYLFNSTILNNGDISNDKIISDLTTMTKTATYNGSNQISPSDNEDFKFEVNKDSFNLSLE